MNQDLDKLDQMMKIEIDRVKTKYHKIKTESIERHKAGKYKRKSIPKAVKDKVWDEYMGVKNGTGPCHCCQGTIDSKNFDCGHIVAAAEGGENIVENLRPLCSTCNKSMGKENMNSFIQLYFRKRKPKKWCFGFC